MKIVSFIKHVMLNGEDGILSLDFDQWIILSQRVYEMNRMCEKRIFVACLKRGSKVGTSFPL